MIFLLSCWKAISIPTSNIENPSATLRKAPFSPLTPIPSPLSQTEIDLLSTRIYPTAEKPGWHYPYPTYPRTFSTPTVLRSFKPLAISSLSPPASIELAPILTPLSHSETSELSVDEAIWLSPSSMIVLDPHTEHKGGLDFEQYLGKNIVVLEHNTKLRLNKNLQIPQALSLQPTVIPPKKLQQEFVRGSLFTWSNPEELAWVFTDSNGEIVQQSNLSPISFSIPNHTALGIALLQIGDEQHEIDVLADPKQQLQLELPYSGLFNEDITLTALGIPFQNLTWKIELHTASPTGADAFIPKEQRSWIQYDQMDPTGKSTLKLNISPPHHAPYLASVTIEDEYSQNMKQFWIHPSSGYGQLHLTSQNKHFLATTTVDQVKDVSDQYESTLFWFNSKDKGSCVLPCVWKPKSKPYTLILETKDAESRIQYTHYTWDETKPLTNSDLLSNSSPPSEDNISK
ncbi:MAG: hypothetical protein CMK59_06425, partial [Proteobacteria bacterium]|nr:hypothetical protein [Pseudomonadota bacterium]